MWIKLLHLYLEAHPHSPCVALQGEYGNILGSQDRLSFGNFLLGIKLQSAVAHGQATAERKLLLRSRFGRRRYWRELALEKSRARSRSVANSGLIFCH